MASIIPTGSISFYIFVAAILLGVVRISWRTLANYRGTAFSVARTVVYAGVYVTLGVGFSALSFLEGVPYLMAVPAVALVAATGIWSYRYSDRRISFWKTTNGSLFFRGGVVVYLIYLGGFLTRLLIDVAFVGPSMFDLGSVVQLSGVALYASMASDLLLASGIGLLIGRNVRVVRRFQGIQRGLEAVPNAPILRKVPAW